MKKLILTTIAIIFCYAIHCQTIINSGPVSGTWTATGSPYHIMGDIEVPSGNILIIESGVTVKIFSELSFIVNGQLLIEGSETDSVFFISVALYWQGLKILNSIDTCKLLYCKFQNFARRSTEPYGEIYGGAIYSYNAKIIISNSAFVNNRIILNHSGSLGYGGVLYCLNTYLMISQCNFNGNFIKNVNELSDSNDGLGGAIYLLNGIAFISKNIFNHNYIELEIFDSMSNGQVYCFAYGGAIFTSANSSYFSDNIIINNFCSTNSSSHVPEIYNFAASGSIGGGIYCSDNSLNYLLKNNLIKNNSCMAVANAGYGLEPSYSSATSKGGGVYGGFIENNTILNNSINASALEIIEQGSGSDMGFIKNSIIYGNTGASQISNANVTYSCVQNGYSGQGNISSDPLFVNLSQSDYHLKQPPCQSQLSPCVDAGNPNTSLFAGTTRTDEYPDLGTIDMGFHYELTNPIVIADFNSDINCGVTPFIVNFFDNSYQYQMDSIKYEWDFQNDGIIDSNEENPVWTYNENGLYSVKQKITGNANNTIIIDSIVKENFIISSDDFLVLASFTSDKSYGEYPLAVTFNDSSLITPCGEINQWRWDFQNDGIIDSYLQNPLWTYSEPSIYSIKLIAGNSNYMVYDTILKPDYITICRMVPEFYAEPVSGDVPLAVDFFDTSFVENTQISTWKWDFQHDGLIDAYGPNPTWTYPEAGNYSVELRITDTSGQIWKSVVKEYYIQVNSITGFSQLAKESINDKLQIYPNPFTNDLIIEFEFNQPDVATVQVFNVAFKPVATIVKDENVIAGIKNWKWETLANNNPSGIYYIYLKTLSGKQYIKKCIKVE